LTTLSISQVLCTLFILTDLLVSAVIRLNPKHWVKRPLNHNIIEYAVAGVDPLWDLGVRMMRRAGEAGVAGAIRLSRHALQRNYDRADQTAPAQNTRCASFLPSVNNSRFGCIQTSVPGLIKWVAMVLSAALQTSTCHMQHVFCHADTGS